MDMDIRSTETSNRANVSLVVKVFRESHLSTCIPLFLNISQYTISNLTSFTCTYFVQQHKNRIFMNLIFFIVMRQTLFMHSTLVCVLSPISVSALFLPFIWAKNDLAFCKLMSLFAFIIEILSECVRWRAS